MMPPPRRTRRTVYIVTNEEKENKSSIPTNTRTTREYQRHAQFMAYWEIPLHGKAKLHVSFVIKMVVL